MPFSKLKKITISVAAAALLSSPLASYLSQPKLTEAAIFTTAERDLVNNLQADYEALDKTPYSAANLYAVAPSLVDPFNAGQLNQNYLAAQVAYINYYRSLFDLGPINSNQADNEAAQVTASVMAAAQANPFVDQHGLNSLTKPEFIDDEAWMTARQVSSSSNLNFNTYDETAGDVIADFLKDSNNLSGADTGHRAWLLSTRLSQTGLGAAYGANGYRYSVQTVMYGNDIFKAPTKSTVAYPSTGVFPIELLTDGVPWSFYISNQKISGTPIITIRDVDTNQTVNATGVGNYSSNNYGNFNTILTYFPTGLNLVSGHEYQVDIQGVTTYNFKLYNQIRANQPPFEEVKVEKPQIEPKKPEQVVKDELTKEAEALRDSLMATRLGSPIIFGRSYQDGKKFHNLGANQWFHDFYAYSNPEIEAGVVDIKELSLNHEIYTSPYENEQFKTHTYITRGSYPYGQKIENGKNTWYYLGPETWIKQKTIKSNFQTK